MNAENQKPTAEANKAEPKAISPIIKLWTISEFDKTRRDEMKSEIIITAVGIALLFIGLGIRGGALDTLGFIIAVIGAWVGILRWAVRLFNTPDFPARRRATGKYKVWYRDGRCNSCGKTSTISIGYLEYQCAECGEENLGAFGIDYMNASLALRAMANAPVDAINNGIACFKCKKLNILSERPAEFICQNCQSIVHLEKIPV